MDMRIIEPCCLAIVLFSLLMRARQSPDPRRFLWRYLLLAAAAWLGEDSCIRLYDFYEYSPEWSLFIDHVPIMILLIWPIVILSAADLALALGARRAGFLGLLAGAFVLADAAFIEPISVSVDFWFWKSPGLFGVPPIGVLGWAYFSGIALAILRDQDDKGWPWDAVVLLVAPVGTHLLLLLSWWLVFKWISAPIPVQPALWFSYTVSLVASVGLWVMARRSAPRAMTLWMRVPAALFFLGLLLSVQETPMSLWIYAGAFVFPYSLLTALSESKEINDEDPVSSV